MAAARARMVAFVQFLLTLFTASTVSSVTFSPLQPPSFPLAVRSPYLSTWMPGSLVSDLPSNRAQFWYGNVLTWSVLANVENVTYNLFGVGSPESGTLSASVISASYTSTHSVFNLTAGNADISLDFFSPVSPKNLIRQSLPFSYLTVTVSGSGSSTPAVSIYSDIDGTWTGQLNAAAFTHTTTGDIGVFEWTASNTAAYSQNSNEQALWGEAVYASFPSDSSTLSSAAGPLSSIRSQFVSNGYLSDSYASWTANAVTGFAHSLGTVSDSTSVTFVVGHTRGSEATNYFGSAQAHYYLTEYADTLSAVAAFVDDYESAYEESLTFDDLIQSVGESSDSSEYADILALSVRQVFGGIDLTVPASSLSTNTTYAFIKEISSDGNMNTVDIIYPSFPLFYVVAPDFIKYLLLPVLDYLASGAFPYDYPVHDIGANYPNATGHNDGGGENMPIEESGNMLILLHAYETASGGSDLREEYVDLFDQWAQYLADNGQYPAAQLSVNDALGALPNQTNLGVKAAVGLATYAATTGKSDFASLGQAYAETIWTDRVGTDSTGTYFTLEYGVEPWFLVFNVYADVLFGLDVFPAETYNTTSAFYPTVRDTAGIPLEGAVLWGQTNWQMFVAATVNSDTRSIFIEDLHTYISNGLNTQPFSDRYFVTSSGNYVPGDAFAFRARPTLGSHFATAALNNKNVWS